MCCCCSLEIFKNLAKTPFPYHESDHPNFLPKFVIDHLYRLTLQLWSYQFFIFSFSSYPFPNSFYFQKSLKTHKKSSNSTLPLILHYSSPNHHLSFLEPAHNYLKYIYLYHQMSSTQYLVVVQNHLD